MLIKSAPAKWNWTPCRKIWLTDSVFHSLARNSEKQLKIQVLIGLLGLLVEKVLHKTVVVPRGKANEKSKHTTLAQVCEAPCA